MSFEAYKDQVVLMAKTFETKSTKSLHKFDLIDAYQSFMDFCKHSKMSCDEILAKTKDMLKDCPNSLTYLLPIYF